ncbi:zinc ribbon domain-containing protein [Ornithinibacillus gellani]|uniref:zinc ribbon domain-containing protein n=1 Tax=Ornithinibacillus gellani TaxID=2293253 RepID=UPI000F49FFE4|nr:zinc ribbon domain-containing protein [Ornithinibacillus gellani]
MLCPTCGNETEAGKFCTSCGAQLTEEPAATSDPTITPAAPTEQKTQEQTNLPPNESVEKIKKAGANFGTFFLTLLKQPSKAKDMNAKEIVSGIISIVLFSLIISLSSYIMLSAAFSGLFSSPSFVDSFLLPFIQFLILFAIVGFVTFGGIKLAAGDTSIAGVFAKYGAYLTPFLILFVLGAILGLIQLPWIPVLMMMVSIIGPLLAIPTFIVLEHKENGFDQIFVLIGIYIINLLAFGLLMQSFMNMLMGSLFDGIMGGFGF